MFLENVSILSSKLEFLGSCVTKLSISLFQILQFSGYVLKHGRKEITEYLDTLGGSPLLNGDSWDSTKYDIAKVIEQESYYGLLKLLGYQIRNRNGTFTFNFKGLRYSYYNYSDTIIYAQYKSMLHEMFQTFKLGTNDRNMLETKFNRSIERVKAFDNVNDDEM